jgi:flagellar biosynthetic protein FliR
VRERVSVDLATASLIALALGSLRAAAWMLLSPPFNAKSIPGPVKGLLSVAIALPVMPKLAERVPELNGGELFVSAIEQIVVGAALGFLTSIFFAAVQAAGSLIDVFGGFSVAFAFDPLSSTGNSVFGRFYNLLATTLLFVTNGHEMVLRGFTRSYSTLPLDATMSISTLEKLLTGGLIEMFISALQIAGPLIAVLFLADIGLGLLNRVAPSLNAFSLGFPLKIMLTLGLAGTAIVFLPQTMRGLVEQAVSAMLKLAGA